MKRSFDESSEEVSDLMIVPNAEMFGGVMDQLVKPSAISLEPNKKYDEEYSPKLESMVSLSISLDRLKPLCRRGFFITHHVNADAISFLSKLLKKFNSSYHERMKLQTTLRVNYSGLPVNVGSVLHEICRYIRFFLGLLMGRIRLFEEHCDYVERRNPTSMRVSCQKVERCAESILFSPCFHSVCQCKFLYMVESASSLGLLVFFCPVCGEAVRNCLSSEDYRGMKDTTGLLSKMKVILEEAVKLEQKVGVSFLTLFFPSRVEDFVDEDYYKYSEKQNYPEKGIKLEPIQYHAL